MKLIKLGLVALLVVCGTSSAWARHGGVVVGVGVGFGPGYWGPGYYRPYGYYPPYAPYYPPYYPGYYPPVVVQHVDPPVYVEQPLAAPVQPASAAPGAGSAANQFWYYCVASKTYYPYVKDCAGGWQAVSPQPQPPAP